MKNIIILHISLHIKYLLLLSDFKQTSVFLEDIQSSDIKFHQNLSIGSEAVTCRQTNMTKQIVTFCNVANILKNSH